MPPAADPPSSNLFGDAFRRIQDVGTQLSEAARAMADDFARSPGGRFAEPMVRLGSQTAELATMWVAPVRAVLQEQQELMEAMATWAEQQRELAERFAKLAERHRLLTEQVTSVLDPWLEQMARAGRAGSAAGSRPDED